MKMFREVRDDLVLREQEEQAKKLMLARVQRAVEMGAQMVFSRAHSIETSIAGPDRAEAIFRRNKEWYRAPEIAEAILRACDGDSTQLAALRSVVVREGALLEERSLSMFQQWLQDPLHVIAEASGIHPDPDSVHHNIRVIAADCHLVLPEDRKGAERVVPLPVDDGRNIYDHKLLEKLQKADPSVIGYIDQICVTKGFAHLRMAAAARHRAFQTIIRDIDRENPIEHMIGWAFCIQGLEMEDGTIYQLDAYDQESIANMISLLMNERSERCPATILARTRDHKIPVEFTYDGRKMKGWILTDWFCLDHQTARVQL